MTSSASKEPADFITAEALGPLHVTRDGCQLLLGLMCKNEKMIILSLPTDCLKDLIVTLPHVMKKALRIRFHDESLRLVYSVKDMTIEQSTDPAKLIATFTTDDGFEISFGITREQLSIIGEAEAILEKGGITFPDKKAN